MNIGREHIHGGEGFTSWRDTQVRIVGQGATILQAVFAVDWYNAVCEDLFAARYFPDTRERGGAVPVQILTSGPDSEWAAIRQLYFSMIVSARRHVFMQSPYFILDASIAEALKAASLAGVDVRVMLTARPPGDPLPGWNPKRHSRVRDRRSAEARWTGTKLGHVGHRFRTSSLQSSA